MNRAVLTATALCAILAAPAAHAQADGRVGGVPPNPFASNYPSAPPPSLAPVHGKDARGRSPRRAARPRGAEPLRPPRDIPY